MSPLANLQQATLSRLAERLQSRAQGASRLRSDERLLLVNQSSACANRILVLNFPLASCDCTVCEGPGMCLQCDSLALVEQRLQERSIPFVKQTVLEHGVKVSQ